MTTTDRTDTPTAHPGPDAALGQLLQVLNGGAACVLVSLGHQTGLFDTLAALPPATSTQVADAAGLDERYVREWLAGVASAGLVGYDPAARTFTLPEHRAPFLTGTGSANLARLLHLVTVMAQVAPDLVPVFRDGGGLHYADYPDFHHLQAADSGPVFDALLLEVILPVTGELERLRAGIEVLDIGCGAGHAVNLMAQAFPHSRFTGVDFEADAITAARREATAWGLHNTTFVVCDAAAEVAADQYDLVTAFDAVHDQARPEQVLANVATGLRPGGTFLMGDIAASSHLENNLDLPYGAFLYMMSTVHCMPVSLGQGGAGLGAAWGVETAETLVRGAGLTDIRRHRFEANPFAFYLVARK